jgi:hypothetical protein
MQEQPIKIIKGRSRNVYELPENERNDILERVYDNDFTPLEIDIIKNVIKEQIKWDNITHITTIPEVLLQKILDIPCVHPIVISEREGQVNHLVVNNKIIVGLSLHSRPWVRHYYPTLKFDDAIRSGVYDDFELILKDSGSHIPLPWWVKEITNNSFSGNIQNELESLYSTIEFILIYAKSNPVNSLYKNPEEIGVDADMFVTRPVPYSVPRDMEKVNKLFQSVLPFTLNTSNRYSVIITMIRLGMIDAYTDAYVTGEKPVSLEMIKRKQIDNKLANESKIEYMRKYLDEIVYRQIYEQKFNKKSNVVYSSILDGLTDEMKAIILKEKERLDILMEEMRSNNCPHITLYNKYITSGDKEILGQLESYFKGDDYKKEHELVSNYVDGEEVTKVGGSYSLYNSRGRVGGAPGGKKEKEIHNEYDGYVYCNNCNFKIMCEHILHNDNLDKYRTESPIDGSYYCRICSEYLGEADDTISLDNADRKLYARNDDLVQSFLWRQVYFCLKIIKWKGNLDDATIRKYVASITETLYPYAKSVYDALYERKADALPIIESKRRVYTSLYIFGYLWKIADDYPGKIELAPLNSLNGIRLMVAQFNQMFNKDIHSLKLSHKSIEDAIKTAYSKVSSEFVEKEKDDEDYQRIFSNPTYSYIWSINAVDVLLNGGKVPKYKNTKFLLGKELDENIFYSTFKNTREPNWNKWKKVVQPFGWKCKEMNGETNPNKTTMEIVSQSCYYDIMKESYIGFIDHLNGKPMDVKESCVGYYLYFNLFNKPIMRKIPHKVDISFRKVEVDIKPVDYDRIGFFNYYAVRCPVPEKQNIHNWVDDVCTQCKGKRDDIIKKEDSYYNKYVKTYDDIVNTNIKMEKEFTVNRIKESLVVNKIDIPIHDFKDIEKVVQLFVDKFYEEYKIMTGTKWSRKEFFNVILYIGCSENNYYSSIVEGKPNIVDEYNRLHTIRHYMFNIVVDVNLVRNGLASEELIGNIVNGKLPDDLVMDHDDIPTYSYLLNILLTYLLSQDKKFSLYELNRIIKREQNMSMPNPKDVSEFKANYSTQGEFDLGDEKGHLETPQEQKVYYDFDYSSRSDADTDEAIFI